MPTVIGVDGCPKGWCAVRLDTDSNRLSAFHLDTFFDILKTFPRVIIAIDVPIGLMDGPGGRDCDREARAIIGWPRRNSVFSPPARQTLPLCGHKDRYREACAVNREATEGTAISQQSFWIGPKIREVDGVMTTSREKRVHEVHPEVSFATMAGHPMRDRKSRTAGREERWRHLRKEFPQLPAAPVRPPELGRDCDIADYIDAIACAWTAARIASGVAESLPKNPPQDNCGLPMAIWR